MSVTNETDVLYEGKVITGGDAYYEDKQYVNAYYK